MSLYGFKNAKVYIRGKGVVRTDVAWRDGVISAVGENLDIIPVAETGDCLLTCGFIDEHVHGADGADVMDGTEEALSVISRALAREGTTSFLATTMTQSEEKLSFALKAVAGFSSKQGARLLGVHLEGPFVSRKFAGAQPSEFIAPPSVAYFRRLQDYAGGKIREVTLAPEEDFEYGLTKYLKDNGVTVAAGHSSARESEIVQALNNGLSCITHTFNAQSPVHHREIGVAGAALLYDELFCEVIADTAHVSVPALKLLLKNKPKDKIILITDSMRAKGTDGGVSELGGQAVYVKDGRARLKDGTLAGSVLKMNEAVANLVFKCGASVETAIDCATFNPAKNLGIEKEYGSIREGAKADFALLNDDFKVMLTVVGGNIV